jgi:gliding motility associated protien GldN
MKTVARIIISVSLFLQVCESNKANAQQSVLTPGTPPLNGVYIPEHIERRKPLAYTSLREADVLWSKWIWRTVDLREKMNLPLYYPEEPTRGLYSLFDLIKKGVMTGELTAYDKPVIDDEFHYEMTISQVQQLLDGSDTVLVQNVNTGAMDRTIVPNPVSSSKIKQFWIKEVWFFDKQRSVLDVRIVGISPLMETLDKTTNEFRGYKPLFYLYFPQCRPYFARYETYNRHNDTERRTFDDIFHKRLFSSVIRKESNVFDRVVMDYATNMNALLESDRIKEEIFILEHDMWHF